MKNVQGIRRLTAALLAAGVFLSGLPSVAAEAQKTYTSADFQLSAGAAAAGCTMTDDETGGIVLSKRERNDNHATSSVWMDAFVFSADVEILDGSNPILTFGVQNRDDVPSGDWYAVCPNRGTDAPAHAARIFKVSGGGLSLNESVPMSEELLAKTAYNMKVSVDNDKNIRFYIDDRLLLSCRDLSYSGGYLGLLSWDAQVRFSNIQIEPYEAQGGDGFQTNLTGLAKAGDNGSWATTSDGFTGQGVGDSFALSQTAPTDFIYTAEVNIASGDAASLVFRSSADGKNAYVANVDLGSFANARIFKFTDSGAVTLGEYKIPDTSVRTYTMRVEVRGTEMRYFLNDRLIIRCSDAEFSSGCLGLLVCNATAVFDQVYYTELTDDAPVVDTLSLTGAELSPDYAPSVKSYSGAVDHATDRVTLTLGAQTEVTVSGYNRTSGLDILPPTVYKEPVQISLGEGENVLLVRPKNGETIVMNIKRRPSDAVYYNEPYRPQFHITPESGWLNDPNGLVYYEGEYHVFYQYYPDSKYAQDMKYWAHMVSSDLVHWQELPVALAPDAYGSMWSGSCVADLNNTSGLFDDTESHSGLVIYYTCTDPNGLTQRQCMAYSKDKGRSWIKYNGGAPILDADDDPLKDGAFRDPKVFWHEESDRWMMICAGGPVRFFSSKNLIDWKPEGMQPELSTECADFYKMKAAGSETEKWVLSGGGVWYQLGDFKQVDGVWKFVSDGSARRSFNSAADTYAGVTFNNAPDDRRIMMSWMVDLGYSNQTGDVTDPYNGALTVPYELTLVPDGDGYRIDQAPVRELESLRGDPVNLDGVTVDETTLNPLKGVLQETFEIDAVLSETQAETVGFVLRAGGGKQTVVQYDSKRARLTLDRRDSGKSPASGFLTAYSETVRPRDGKLAIKILVDRSSVELFADGKAFTSLIFPESDSVGMELFAKGGAATFDTLRVYPLHSIFRTESPAGAAQNITVSSGKTRYGVSETFTVFAVPDSPGAEVHAQWRVSDDKVLNLLEQGSNYAVVRTIAAGTASVIAVDGAMQGEWKITAENHVFNTNLTDLEAAGGSWEVTADGLEGSGRGNAPIFSQSRAGDFEYTADVRYLDGDVGAALIFRASDDLSVYYTADICERDRRARLLKFTANRVTGAYSDVTLGKAGTLRLTADHRYTLRVRCEGSTLSFYVNDRLVTTAEDKSSLEGRFGLNVCDIRCAFQNVYYEPIQPQKPDDQKPSDQKPSGNTPSTPQNGTSTVGGKTVLYKNGKPVGGTVVETVGGVTYAVVGGFVSTAAKTHTVKIGKTTYIADKNGVILTGSKNRKVTIGKTGYVVNGKGAVQKATGKYKAIKVGKKTVLVNKNGVVQKPKKTRLYTATKKTAYIVNKSGYVRIAPKKYKVVKVGKKRYVVNKKGVVLRNKKSLKIGKVGYKINAKGVAKKK